MQPQESRGAEQRGNITLITAMTVVLMTLMVLFATGIAQTGAGANNMQASADQGALAAAEGFLASLNDQAFLDSVQWGVDAVGNLGHAITVVAAILASSAAAAAATLFGIGVAAALAAAAAVLFPIGIAITSVGESISGVLDPIFSVLRTIISVVKWIASELNAALIADGNGYNGFMIPVNLGQAPGAKLSAGDIKTKAVTIEESVVDYPTNRATQDFPRNLTTLKDTIRLQGLTYFWTDRTPGSGQPNAKDNKPVSVRAQPVYHITDGEKTTLLNDINQPFQQELDQLTLLRAELNDSDPKKNRFDDTSGSIDDVNKVLDRVIGELKETINGGSQPDPSCEGFPDPTLGCPIPLATSNVGAYIAFSGSFQPWGFGTTSHRNNSKWVDDAAGFFNKTDKGQACTSGGKVPGGEPPKDNPVHNFVYTDTNKNQAFETFPECTAPASLSGGPPDIRSSDYFGQVYGGDAGAYATWVRDANKTIKGKTDDKDDGKRHLTFLEFKALDPTVEEELTARLSGHEVKGRFAVAISQADVLLAKDQDDKISFRSTCAQIFPGPVDSTTLGFIPDTAAAICAAIADFIINTVSFINQLPLGMDAVAKAILGDTPEVRTYHAVLRHIPPNQYICEAVNIIKSFQGPDGVLNGILKLIWKVVAAFATSTGDDYNQTIHQILDGYNCSTNTS